MNYLLLLPICFPLIMGILLFLIKLNNRQRNIYSAIVMIITVVMSIGVCFFVDGSLEIWQVTEKISISLYADNLTKMFTTFMTIVFTSVGIYAFEYMKHEEYKNRFFAFYLMLMGVLNGIYMSSNLISMYFFYEFMTILSFPLVIHNLSKESISAGYKYMFYSVAGAFLALFAIIFVAGYSDTLTFKAGGFIDMQKLSGHEGIFLVFVFITIIGFGCKAGLFPLQEWLPIAHPVAPAPASAVLSGVITKSGVFAIIRFVFYCIGADNLRGTWVQYGWMILALLTVFLGSMMAYRENVMKKRFAYSTVSQVSYILFGLSVLHPVGMMGALLHVIFHSVIKDDLFMISGVIIHNTKETTISGLKGIGKRMPVTIWCFTISALSLIGIPPLSGFISKWFLATGSIDSQIPVFRYLGPAILLVSALLTAGYLLPVTMNGFFPGKDYPEEQLDKCEAKKLALIPIIFLAIISIVLGLFPGLIQNGLQLIITEIF